MKLFNSVVLTLIGLLILTTSCNNKMTYSDHLKAEKKAIDLLIAKNNLSILGEFPANGQFRENEFYKDPNTGVYFRIIELGDTSIKPQWREKIYIRFKGLHYFRDDSDTARYSNYQSTRPEELEYVGPISSSTRNSYANAGWAVPLTRVGHKGKVRMIIPFEMGSTYDQTNYQPTYYEQVEYWFDGRW